MKVVFQHHGLINDNYKSFFKSNLPKDVEFVYPKNKEELLESVQGAKVFVGYSVTREFMDNANALTHIQIPWTGFNSLDTAIMSDYPTITVSNSHSNSLSIAEHAVALLFSAARLIPFRDKQMRQGDWSSRYQPIEAFWVTGKKLGIIGYGAIGKKVAKMMKNGFNMEILAIKRSKGDKEDKDEICRFLGDMIDMDYVLQESDFILVAVPLTDETKGLIGKNEFSKMKQSAVIVNIARGPIIEEEALYKSLKDGQIGAAGVDVWYNYPKSSEVSEQTETRQNYPFEELDSIVMSPHSAFKVRDREEIFSRDILENIRRIYDNKEPINQVNLDLGY